MSKAIAFIIDTNKNSKGTVEFEQIDKKRVKIRFNLANFAPLSIHAIHIHEYGDLSRGCDSLGGHYNPTHSFHGNFNLNHRHKGDLINNFETSDSGSFKFTFIDNLVVSDLFGRSIVIHEYPDDLGMIIYDDFSTSELAFLSKKLGYPVRDRREMIRNLNKQSLVTGNAGSRIACGIIGRCT